NGGRGTRGAVYRVRYPAGLAAVRPEAVARLRAKPRSLDWQPARSDGLLRAAAGGDARERRRALEDLHRHRDRFPTRKLLDAVRANGDHADRYVRLAAARLVARLGPEDRR